MTTRALIILDGVGIRQATESNAFAVARKPTFDALLERFANSQIETSGLAVGLPQGQMGNSEVGRMNLGTEDASQGMIRQNSEIEMAATAVTEMSAEVAEVASNAALASDAANQSSATASSGRSRVDETLGAIGLMVSSVRSTSSEVKHLSVMAVDISKVLDVIRAIEAVRAGEAGRGFAVVANEVRALAHRTQVSTQEIETMITGIQSGTSTAAMSMDETTYQAEKTLHLAEAAGQALAEITESVLQINERSLLISTAAEEQAAVAREVDRSLISIHDLSTRTAADSHKTSVVSDELSKLTAGLNGLVERFRL